METISDWVQQETIENQFNKKLINNKLHALLNKEYNSYVEHGVKLINQWLQSTYYESKNKRLALVKQMDLEDVVEKLLVGTFFCQTEELFTSVSGRLAGVLGFSDKPDAIKTVAEMLAVLCHTDAFDILKNDANSLVIICRLHIPVELQTFIENTMFMPPMVCEPKEIKTNFDSGYLTLKDSLILGKGNFHGDDICLDALNIANSVQLTLSKDFLSYLDMNPTKKWETQQQEDQFNKFRKDTYKLMVLLAKKEKFWLTHAYDKRGRVYSRGYMVNTQGFAFQKACIEFAEQETIDVPTEYMV